MTGNIVLPYAFVFCPRVLTSSSPSPPTVLHRLHLLISNLLQTELNILLSHQGDSVAFFESGSGLYFVHQNSREVCGQTVDLLLIRRAVHADPVW